MVRSQDSGADFWPGVLIMSFHTWTSELFYSSVTVSVRTEMVMMLFSWDGGREDNLGSSLFKCCKQCLPGKLILIKTAP